MKSKLELLKEQVAELKRLQSTCQHEWGDPFEDTIQVPIYKEKRQGVDVWPGFVGYRDVPCTARVCKKCEKKEVATETEEVVVKTERRLKFRDAD